MADDWRVTVELGDESSAKALVGELESLEAGGGQAGERIVVSSDESTVFLYADSEEGARRANTLVCGRLAELGVERTAQLTRWHPVEQAWEDAAVPLPSTDEEVAAERARLRDQEEAESRATGEAFWEVRVELHGHGETRELAERLEDEGMSVVRRWRYLLVGAASEDDARQLAERLRAEAPPGSRVAVEPGGGAAWEVAPQNPFAVFGGFGG